MNLRRLIASGLFLVVLLAPAMNFALCRVDPAAARSACPHCAEMSHMAMHPGHAPAPATQSPCCQRHAPMPARAEAAAPPVAQVLLGLLPATAMDASPAIIPTPHARQTLSPPSSAPPLELLCTLLI